MRAEPARPAISPWLARAAAAALLINGLMEKLIKAENEIKLVHFGLAIRIKNTLTAKQQEQLRDLMQAARSPDRPLPGAVEGAPGSTPPGGMRGQPLPVAGGIRRAMPAPAGGMQGQPPPGGPGSAMPPPGGNP